MDGNGQAAAALGGGAPWHQSSWHQDRERHCCLEVIVAWIALSVQAQLPQYIPEESALLRPVIYRELQIGQTCDMPLARNSGVCNLPGSGRSIGVRAPASLCDSCVPLAQLTDCPAHCRIYAGRVPNLDPYSLDQGLKHYMNSTSRMTNGCGSPV